MLLSPGNESAHVRKSHHVERKVIQLYQAELGRGWSRTVMGQSMTERPREGLSSVLCGRGEQRHQDEARAKDEARA